MKQKRILLLGGNYFPEPTGIGKYNGEMMDWFSANGYDCTVITTYPYYPFWKVQSPYKKGSFWYSSEKKIKDNTTITIYRCPHYVPRNPTGRRRMLSDISFFFSAFFRLFIMLFQRKHDYVIAVVPPFQLGLLALLYKWIRRARFVYHIQDLQIDAAGELGMIRSKFLLRMMFRIEKFILRKADHISTISEGMIRRVMAKCNKPVILFPNWVDTTSFYPLPGKEVLKKKFNFSPEETIVLYSGAIGEKQGLESILYAALELRNTKIRFVICGSGPYKEKLVKMTGKMELGNISFLPLQSSVIFNEFLNIADIHLVLQKANANDLMMPSKLTTILSVGGLALVTASKDSDLEKIISTYKIGVPVEPENQIALTEAIRNMARDTYQDTRSNARRYAEENLSIERIMIRFLHSINDAEKEGRLLVKA